MSGMGGKVRPIWTRQQRTGYGAVALIFAGPREAYRRGVEIVGLSGFRFVVKMCFIFGALPLKRYVASNRTWEGEHMRNVIERCTSCGLGKPRLGTLRKRAICLLRWCGNGAGAPVSTSKAPGWHECAG